MYSRPRLIAFSAMASMLAVPSLQVLWMWKSPLMSSMVTRWGNFPSIAASISPLFSRSSGGIRSIPRAR